MSASTAPGHDMNSIKTDSKMTTSNLATQSAQPPNITPSLPSPLPQHPNDALQPTNAQTLSSDEPPIPEPPPPADSQTAAKAAALRRTTVGLPPMSEVQRVQRKWQMASIVHFLDAFRDVLPFKLVSEDLPEDLTPIMLERAVAEPELDKDATVLLKQVIQVLLVAAGVVSKTSVAASWFQSLRVFVWTRKAEFMDCFEGEENLLGRFENGMDFLTFVGWNVRLGMLLSLCDIAAEVGVTVREAIRESELASTCAKSDLNMKGYRLASIGRCSQKRAHYIVGKTRIYSGYKRKGSGALVVECSDSKTMTQLSHALAGEGQERDSTLSEKIRTTYLAPVLQLEEKSRRKIEKKRMAEVQREESRRRNSVRPRRSKATYM